MAAVSAAASVGCDGAALRALGSAGLSSPQEGQNLSPAALARPQRGQATGCASPL